MQEIVNDAGDAKSAHDFGKSIVTGMYRRKNVFVYNFATNEVPGQTERERGYWRDVGNLDAYFQANMDLVEVDPVFSLYNDRWPIYTHHANAPRPSSSSTTPGRAGSARPPTRSSRRAASSPAPRCTTRSSPSVRLKQLMPMVEDCIIFEKVTIARHCRIRRAIIDKHVEIPAGTVIGDDLEADKRRFHVTESGIVVIPKGMRVEPG